MDNTYDRCFNKYWKDNMMDARLKILHLSEQQFQQIKVELELAFAEGYRAINNQNKKMHKVR